MNADAKLLVPHAVAGSQRLGGVAGVDEQQGGAVPLYHAPAPSHAGDQLGVAQQAPGQVAVLIQDLGRLHPEIQLLGHVGADDVDLPAGAGEEAGDLFHGAHRGRQADALELAGQLRQPLQGDGQLGSPLVAGQLVDLVDDHPLHPGDVLPEAFAGEQHLKRLRGGDQHVRGVPRLRLPLRLRGIAVTDGHSQLERLPELGEAFQHVPVQGAERRDVDALDPLARLLEQAV